MIGDGKRRCRVCGCTDDNACLVDVRTGDVVQHLNADQQIDFDAGADDNVNVEPCCWIEHDLCSACRPVAGAATVARRPARAAAARCTVSKYELTDDVGEISGFGGGYEACCRAMLKAGCEWFDAHPEADPKFRGFRGVVGLIVEDNDDAKALSKILEETARPLGGCTGAMHQYVVAHVLRVRQVGWDAHCAEIKRRVPS